MKGEHGQASVEMVALLPLVFLVATTVMGLLAAGTARERAAAAAQAGAMALIQGTDPRAAAREVVPEGDRPRLAVTVRGRRVTVRLVPDVPLGALTQRLAATSTADAGPAPRAGAAERTQSAATAWAPAGGFRVPSAQASPERSRTA